jgi:hypothetical protein
MVMEFTLRLILMRFHQNGSVNSISNFGVKACAESNTLHRFNAGFSADI